MPVGASKIGVLGAGLVPGGTETFNASGTFTVPPGVKKVNITGKGGTGNPGNSGNTGNPGNTGNAGLGGGGGNAAFVGYFPGGAIPNPTCFQATGRGGKGGINGPAPPHTRSTLNLPACCATTNAAVPGPTGNSGTAGNAGSAGTPGNAGTAGNSSSGLCKTFSGGAAGNGGNAGAAGNAGTGGSGGGGGGGGRMYCQPQPPCNRYPPSYIGAGGNPGGGAGAVGKSCTPDNRIASGGGGAGDTNSGSAGQSSPVSPSFPCYNVIQNCPKYFGGEGGTPGGGKGGASFNPAYPPTGFMPYQKGGDGTNTRAGGGGGGAFTIFSGGGGGRGGTGNAGGAGGAGGAGNPGSAANPATFNCVSVTPGSPYPITVATPGGQVIISWNPQ